MTIDLYEGDALVVSIPMALSSWLERGRAQLGVANPFGFDPYGETTLGADGGDVAAFASAVARLLAALRAADSATLPSLPVYDDELEAELGQIEITQLLEDVITAARRADSVGGQLIFRGE